uniref:Uncharacterized protein n=1 Tax=Arundo donax TaxID=35708 RepID=A0A0A9B7F4_ARUDO
MAKTILESICTAIPIVSNILNAKEKGNFTHVLVRLLFVRKKKLET